MPFSVMREEILEKVIIGLANLPQRQIKFIWHGGEPTLASLDFYQKVVDLQKRYFSHDYRIINSIQTNGSLLDEKWLEFFKENGFRVGISLDGPKEIHDAHRKFKNGKGTFDLVFQNVQRIQEKGISFGIVSVVTKESLLFAREIFDFFSSAKIFKLNFSAASDFDSKGNLLDYAITSEEFGKFMIEIFDLWAKKDDPQIKEQLLDSFMQGLIGGRPMVCTCKRDCSDFVSIDKNGMVYLCGRFLGKRQFRIGNLQKQTYEEMLASRKFKSLVKAMTYERKECLECEWENICNGGCPDHRLRPYGSLNSPYYLCKATKMILEHMSAELKKYKIPTPK